MKSLTFPARKSLLLLLILCSPLHGADLDWEADTGDARWDEQAAPAGGDVNTNWENDVLPAATDSVTFDASGQNELTVDLNGDRTVLSLTFNYSQSYTLNNSTLTLDDGFTVSDGDHIINSNVILSDDTSEWALFDIGTNDSLTINGILSGDNPITKDGGGDLIFTGANTITSGVTISSGRLILKDGDDRLPTDTQLTIGVGAELEIDGISQTIGQLVPQDGSINLINNGVFRVGNGDESGGFAGTITGNGSLVKLGNALLELNGASTYSGDTTINAGTLRVGNSTGSATGTGLVTVTNNAALDGTGSVGGAVTVDSGGTIAPGTSVGTLSVSGGLTLNGDFVCEIDGATADQLAVAGTLDVTGGDLEISILNPPTSGSYVIATAGTVTGPFANVTGLPDSYVLSYSAGAVTIEIPDLLYVDENAAPGGDGLSWATAFDDLQDALTLPLTDTDIWVAQGTYLPDTGTDRSAAFQLLDGVEVLGGFPTPDGGTPDPGLGDRDPDAYPTILSGDLDGNDGSGAPTGNNAYHVVTSSGTDATAILDGFTITNGLADGVDADSDGAGLFNVSGSPIVRNCLFTNCVADRAGGGVFNEETDAAPVFEDCTFLSNVGVLGGAMRNRAGCSPTLKRCLFQENTSPTSAGGAMNTGSQCTVTATNCAFLGNRAAKWGGAVNHGATNSTATYTNCLFSGNLADDAADVEEGYGGAIASRNSAVVTLINTTISGNGASHGGGGMMTSNGGNIDLTNSIVWNNLAVGVTTGLSSSYLNYDAGATTTFSHCLVENATATDLSDATNSLDGTDPANDPLFVLEADPATAPTVLGDFRPMVASPALEVGDNAANTEATDLLGNPRIIDEDANGTATIDLGAYENAAPIVQNPVDILNIRFTGESVVDSIDLSEVFSDPLSGTLSFGPVSNDNSSLVSVMIGAEGVADLTSTGSESGTATLVFSATNSYGTREHTIVFTLSLPTIFYVDSQAGSGGDGSTWADAFDHLQDALAVALVDDQIWVAQGTYYPDEGSGQTDDDRVASFELIDDVAIYGGFPVGGGDGTFEARDLSTATVLSGDLQQDDDSTGTNDNAYHVVQAASSVTELAILDGFTITAGKANSSLLPNSRKRGGGFYCSGAPVISNCLFNGNFAKTYGGAIYNNSGSSSPNISDCSFSGNSASTYGGAIYNTTNASPSITDCSFLDNSADTRGGAIYNSSVKSISILNCSFTGNSSGSTAGAIFNINASATDITGCSFENNSADWGGGAIYNDSVSLAIHNCSFTNNTASDGGAIVNDDASSPYITDCDFSGNSADDDGGAIVNFDGAPEFSSCTFSGNSAAADGGAIYEGSESSASTFINCIFSGNSATNDGGAIYHSSDSVGATLTNCTLSGNSADRGGAFCNLAISASPRSSLTNCTLSGNSAGTNGGAIYNSSASAKPKLINCVIWNNMANGDSTSATASIQDGQSWRYSYCLVANLDLTVTGTANLDGTDPANDPLFFLGVDPATAPTTDGNLRLLAASPAIDIGDNTANTETTDLDGNSRIQGSVIDLGAYENATPYAQDPVQEFEVHIPAGESVPWPLDLADEFTDPLGGTLAFALASNSDPGLVSVTLDANGLADLALSGTGTATLVFSATNAHGTGLLSVTYTLALPATLHVDSQAAPGGDGTSWANAYQHLQDALAVALANDQVWVAQGTYYPDEGTGQANDDRDSTFDLIDGVATYGGFPVGGGDGTFEARDTSAATILSGDLMQDDEPTGTSDNAYHVVQAASSVTEFTLLDGFTITAGNGTGLLCDSSSPTISHCSFSGNEGISGGAIGNFDGSPAFTNCSFSGNKATYGGAMFSALGAPTLINCSFSGNKATADGGALYCSDTLPTLINCIVWNNEANGVSDTASASIDVGRSSSFTYSHCLVANIDLTATGTNNLDGTDPANDPLFILAVDPATAPTTDGDLRLSSASPALGMGDNTANAESTDLDGNARIQGCLIDLGAYEHASNIPAAYCTWIAAQFPGETDPAIIGILADPNGDEVSNGLAFITGYAANAESPEALGIASVTGGILSIEFTEMDEASALNHTIEASFDLQTWVPIDEISPHVTVLLSTSSGQTSIHVESDLTQIPRLFYRQGFEAYPAP